MNIVHKIKAFAMFRVVSYHDERRGLYGDKRGVKIRRGKKTLVYTNNMDVAELQHSADEMLDIARMKSIPITHIKSLNFTRRLKEYNFFPQGATIDEMESLTRNAHYTSGMNASCNKDLFVYVHLYPEIECYRELLVRQETKRKILKKMSIEKPQVKKPVIKRRIVE